PACDQGLPGRGLPKHGKRSAGRTARTRARHQVRPNHIGSSRNAGARLLSRQLRALSIRPDRRQALRPRGRAQDSRARLRAAAMTTRIFVPRDAAALSLGAEEVANAVAAEIAARKLDAKLVRNGSRGLLWLEPLIEVETPAS